MKSQALNPYLPGNEYIPDGEPYVFNNRVYVYGSHDRFNGKIFCLNDYVCWSAPVDDLSDWQYEGIIFKKKEDPKNKLGLRLLFAPDVVQGPDNRFYLYYAFDFMGLMGVAVCDTPAGEYKFLGHVQYSDGTLWGRKKGDSLPFDPAVLNDEGKIYLYSGFYISVPAIATGFKSLKTEGCYVLELEQDMFTIKTSEKLLLPKEGKGSFKNHEFFEASSIRKYNNQYYFVYSSRHNHELCYAISNKPNEGFKFGGTLVSNGDIFLNQRDESEALNYLGNNHGGMLELKGEYYIFYHRHTNRTSYSRQACAEKLEILPDGTFKQAEITSCGLNNGPLIGQGYYEARIACNLWSAEGTGRYDIKNSKRVYKNHPYLTQTGNDKDQNAKQFIANLRDESVAGFKYFNFNKLSSIEVYVRGKAKGLFNIYSDSDLKDCIASIEIDQDTDSFIGVTESVEKLEGTYPLYFKYNGIGYIDFMGFTIN